MNKKFAKEVTTLGDTGQPFKQGLAIIVGNEPDGILVHVAYVLGLNKNGKYFYNLDDIRKEIIDCNDNDIIYLIGHGNPQKHTIDGQNMEYIAEKLWYAGYRGKQILYITSCYAKALTRGMSTLKLMVSYLKKLFGSKINIAPKTSMLNLLREKLEEKGVPHDKIQSDFDGLSITINNNNNNNIQAWNIKAYAVDSKIKERAQKRFLGKNDYLNIHHSLGSVALDNINHFKIGLIQDFGGDIMDPYYGEGWWEGYLAIGCSIFGGIALIGLVMRGYCLGKWPSNRDLYTCCIMVALITGLLDLILVNRDTICKICRFPMNIKLKLSKWKCWIKFLSMIFGASLTVLVAWLILNQLFVGRYFEYALYACGGVLIILGVIFIFKI